MSRQGGKQSFFSKLLFRSNKHNNKELVDGHERRRDRNEVTFANENRYYENRGRSNHSFAVDNNALRDENGFYKATAAYHTNTRTKPSRGTRSCYSKMDGDVPVNYSSDSDNAPSNRSFQSAFNPADVNKRNFRRSSKRHKKSMPDRSMFEDYDEQSSSNTSYNVLQSMDMNAQHRSTTMNEYWKRPSRHHPDDSWLQIELLERKYLESNQKIQEYVNKYRKEKSRAANLQKQVDELTRQARMDIQTIKEHQKQIQKLQEEVERIRNPFMQTGLFNPSMSYPSPFQHHNAAPSSHLYPNFHNQMTQNLSDMQNMIPTRTVSEINTESSEIMLKTFQNDHDGVPEQLISESSLQPSLHDDDVAETARCDLKENSFSADTLVVHSIVSDPIPFVRDKGYSTSETFGPTNKNYHRRSKYFPTAVPAKIRRTNSLN